ncbi:hypothetical protein D3C80_1787010 [compost metagenome]
MSEVVESTMSAVPLIRPKFHPRPSKASAMIRTVIESAEATAARIPAARSVAPAAIAIAVRPILSTRTPVSKEGRYIEPI